MLEFIWNPRIIFQSAEEHNDFILYCVIILEHLWWVRNELWVKEKQPSMEDSINTVRRKFLEFKQVMRTDCQLPSNTSEVNRTREWSPPRKGMLKINTDVAVRIIVVI